jgi:hypothetical protein
MARRATVVDIAHLRAEAFRLHPIDAAAAQLLQRAGDEIQQLRVQRDALLQTNEATAHAVPDELNA